MAEPTKIDLALAIADKNRKPFKKNGVWINLPQLTPNGKIYAIERESGTLVALDRRQDFSAKLHKRWNAEEGTPVDKSHDDAGDFLSPAVAKKQQEERKQAELDALTKELNKEAAVNNGEDQVEQTAVVPEPKTEDVDSEKRWEELKAIGFAALKGPERKEYQDLKKVYG